jgi:hypothetical protein
VARPPKEETKKRSTAPTTGLARSGTVTFAERMFARRACQAIAEKGLLMSGSVRIAGRRGVWCSDDGGTRRGERKSAPSATHASQRCIS